MPSPFDGLAGLFTSALGQAVTIAPGGEPVEIMAIFSARSTDSVGIVQPLPAIHAATVDLGDLSDGEAITVNGVSYVAREFRPDGKGMTTVIMQAA